jgi:hypothetical protein
MDINFYLNGNKIELPKEWEEQTYEIDFNDTDNYLFLSIIIEICAFLFFKFEF